MEQKEDVGTKDVEPSTPRDWSRWLTESARDGSTWLSVDQARRLALVLEGLVATVEQLEAECHRLQELRPSPSWLSDAKVQKDASCSDCVHGMAPLRAIPCRGCHYDPAKPGYSRVATEYRPDPALEGGRHE